MFETNIILKDRAIDGLLKEITLSKKTVTFWVTFKQGV